jgi:hypothetical protein
MDTPALTTQSPNRLLRSSSRSGSLKVKARTSSRTPTAELPCPLRLCSPLPKQEKAEPETPGRAPALLHAPPRTSAARTQTHTHMAGAESGSDLVLLDVFASPYAQRVRIALAEKGLAYESTEEDLAAKSDLLRRSNPAHGGKVPVLLHSTRGAPSATPSSSSSTSTRPSRRRRRSCRRTPTRARRRGSGRCTPAGRTSAGSGCG